MNSKNTVLFLILSILLASSLISAAGIKERMIKRKPMINALKDQEILGENNLGFLVFRIFVKKHENMVNEENQDRRKIYVKIAKNNRTTLKEVGKLRARDIARSTSEGCWLQNPKGKWYRK